MAPLAPDGARIALPRAYWYLACESRDIGERPVSRTVLGTPLVLFRADAEEPAVLLDRCAHRNLPLSEGRVIGAPWSLLRSRLLRQIPAGRYSEPSLAWRSCRFRRKGARSIV